MRAAHRLLIGLLGLAACPRLNEAPGASPQIGATTVALPLAKALDRASETLFGDLVADAYRAAGPADSQVGFINSGSIRCESPSFPATADNQGCVGQAIAIGPITAQELSDVLPFEDEDHLVSVAVTGPALKSTLERSLSGLPAKKSAWFLQVSGLSFEGDCSRAAQVVQTDPSGNYSAIVKEGSRVLAIDIAGQPVSFTDTTTTYTVIANSYTALGKDGHLALAAACAAQGCAAFDPSATDLDTVTLYFEKHNPVSPQLGNRIQLVNCGP